MHWLSRTLRSSIACKALMALTGLALVGFLVAHLAGNLLVYQGPEAINSYSEGLRHYPAVLWTLRFGLIAAVLLHIFAALRLTRLNAQARPIRYQMKKQVKASFASRYMGLTGLVVLAFVIYHLAHLTWRLTHPQFAALGEYDVYQMLVLSFQNPVLVLSYVISILLLALHLHHGVSSLFQSLGLNHPKYNPLLRGLGPGLSIILASGFISIPLAILSGLIK